MTKSVLLSLLIAFGLYGNGLAATYTLCASGIWGDNVGSTTATFCPGNVNAESMTFANGDIIVIPFGMTLTLAAQVSIAEDVTIQLNGELSFDNGKLHLTNASSTIELAVNSTLTCISGCTNNDQIVIGGYQYKGQDLDDINAAPRPSTVDNTGSILPVLLEDYQAKIKNGNVVLSWITTMEENFSEFIVEHSTNGDAYAAIGIVKGQGKNLYDVDTKYDFTDENPFIGRNYYRLKAVDIDNTSEYFGPAVVTVKAEKNVEVYPNPSKGGELFFKSNFTPSENDRLVLVNQLGVELANIPAQNARTTFTFEKQLEAGVYFLKYVGKDFSTTTRVVINR